MSDLKSHFYDAAKFELNSKCWDWKPAVAFEIAHNLSGIANYYNFPEVTIQGETERYSIFFDRHIGGKYSSAVLACYQDVSKDKYERIRIADPDPLLMQQIQEEWQNLKNLNPELGSVVIDINDPLHLYDALRGAASLFNPDDISFFLDLCVKEKSWAAAVNAHKIPGYSELYNRVHSFAGGNPGWVASPETLEKIETQFIARIQPSLNP